MQPQGYQQAPMAPPNNSNATLSLVMGILSFCVGGAITGVLAIIFGNKAKREIAASGGREGGEGMAQAGVVLGWIAVALTIIVVLFYAFIFAAIFSGGW